MNIFSYNFSYMNKIKHSDFFLLMFLLNRIVALNYISLSWILLGIKTNIFVNTFHFDSDKKAEKTQAGILLFLNFITN